MIALAAAVLIAAATPSPLARTHAPAVRGHDYCADALDAERVAGDNATPPAQAYAAAVSGLAANARCDDAQDRALNGAFLLAMKGMAEYGAPDTDWRADLRRADESLTACIKSTVYGPAVRGACRTQLQYDERITRQRENFEKAGGVAPPWPANAAAPPATPAPAVSPAS